LELEFDELLELELDELLEFEFDELLELELELEFDELLELELEELFPANRSRFSSEALPLSGNVGPKVIGRHLTLLIPPVSTAACEEAAAPVTAAKVNASMPPILWPFFMRLLRFIESRSDATHR
jgi:hypothetical protein